MDKDEMYEKGYYRVKTPPVCTAQWSKQDWMRYIDSYDGWITPEQIEANKQKQADYFYSQYRR